VKKKTATLVGRARTRAPKSTKSRTPHHDAAHPRASVPPPGGRPRHPSDPPDARNALPVAAVPAGNNTSTPPPRPPSTARPDARRRARLDARPDCGPGVWGESLGLLCLVSFFVFAASGELASRASSSIHPSIHKKKTVWPARLRLPGLQSRRRRRQGPARRAGAVHPVRRRERAWGVRGAGLPAQGRGWWWWVMVFFPSPSSFLF
jgi:hypothetical protein